MHLEASVVRTLLCTIVVFVGLALSLAGVVLLTLDNAFVGYLCT